MALRGMKKIGSNKNTYKILKQLLAKNLKIENNLSFDQHEYQDLAEMDIQQKIANGVSVDEFQQLRKSKKKIMGKKEIKWIIRSSNDFRLYWDIWIIFLSIWNSLYIPYDIAFQPSFSYNIFLITLNAFIDLNFLIDIFFTFRTTYYDYEGEEVFNWKKIAKKYLLGRLCIDVISTIPLDTLINLTILQTFQLLKLFRLSRISKIIKNLPLKEDLKVLIKVTNVIFMLFMYIHCMACINFLIVNSSKEWCPPLWYHS